MASSQSLQSYEASLRKIVLEDSLGFLPFMPPLLRSSIAKPDSDDTRVETTMLGHDGDFRFSGLSIGLVALFKSPGQLLGDPRSPLALASRRRYVDHVFLFEIHDHRVFRSHEFWPHVFGDARVKELEVGPDTMVQIEKNTEIIAI